MVKRNGFCGAVLIDTKKKLKITPCIPSIKIIKKMFILPVLYQCSAISILMFVGMFKAAPVHKVKMITLPNNKTASIYYFNECFLMQTNSHHRLSSLIVITKIWCSILLYMHLCNCQSNCKNNNNNNRIIPHVNKFVMRHSHSEKLFQFIAHFVLERRWVWVRGIE